MQYALLIYSKPGTAEALSAAEREANHREYMEIKKLPGVVGGAALHPVETATTVRVHDGQTLVTDGPFADTKEIFAGFYLIEADDLDQATELAARIPAARSVSATCASTASAGWQHMKTSSSRSSGMEDPAMASSPIAGSGVVLGASSGSLAASTRSRRSRSIARWRAVVTSQAPGLSGTPSDGQRRAATANASAAASSARSKSPK